MTAFESGPARVLRIVSETQGIQWWIDQRIADGATDEQIARELPAAAAFITGRISLDELLGLVARS